MGMVSLYRATFRFLRWANANLRPRTVDLYAHYLWRFASDHGDIDLRALTPATVTTWRRRFHAVQAVKRLTAWCHKDERSLRVNPLAGMKKLQTGRRRRVLSRAESARLLRASSPCFRVVLLAMRESICRPQEVRALSWGHLLDVGGGPWSVEALRRGRCFFALPEGKGFERRASADSVRIIPVSPRMGRLLIRLLDRTAAGRDYVFLDSRRRPWSANAVRCRMRRLRVAAGMGVDARGESVVAYSMRHTSATAAIVAGVRLSALADLMGHASTRTTERYVHLSAVDLLDSAKRLWEAKSSFARKSDRPRSTERRPD